MRLSASETQPSAGIMTIYQNLVKLSSSNKSEQNKQEKNIIIYCRFIQFTRNASCTLGGSIALNRLLRVHQCPS
uniref:Uncharacterized protein n=1 Tax=Romanomermis culicivorax TaxID=13658 RepID=A0A915JK76_ROMCU